MVAREQTEIELVICESDEKEVAVGTLLPSNRLILHFSTACILLAS
jgi:hypothetical protein